MEAKETMTERYVFLRDIAKHLGTQPDNFVNRILRNGAQTKKVRNPETGHIAHAVTAEEARAIIAAERDIPETMKPEDLFLNPARKDS